MKNNESFSMTEYSGLIREVLDSGGEFRIYPRGTSMLPLIREGKDSAVLKKPEGTLKKGDAALYLRDNGQYVLHRVIAVKDGVYTMCGDNQTAPENGIEQRQVIGAAVRVYRGEKQIPAAAYKLYCLVWRSFLLRKVYFKLRSLKRK